MEFIHGENLILKDKKSIFIDKTVKIGNNVFIGARTIILPGTTIGDNTIIGAGSVVKGNIPSGVIVAGNPARVIKSIEEYANYHLQVMDFEGPLPDTLEN